MTVATFPIRLRSVRSLWRQGRQWNQAASADCKSVKTGSIPVLASNHFKYLARDPPDRTESGSSRGDILVSGLFRSANPRSTLCKRDARPPRCCFLAKSAGNIGAANGVWTG